MTEFSDAMMVLLIFGGYIVHHGGPSGAWGDFTGRFSRVFTSMAPALMKKLEQWERGERL